jgi:hypothetical protein
MYNSLGMLLLILHGLKCSLWLTATTQWDSLCRTAPPTFPHIHARCICYQDHWKELVCTCCTCCPICKKCDDDHIDAPSNPGEGGTDGDLGFAGARKISARISHLAAMNTGKSIWCAATMEPVLNFSKIYQIFLKKISMCSKRRALQICKFLKKNTLYFGHSKKDKYGYFLEYGGPFKIALFIARSTIFSFFLRLEYKIFSYDFYHVSSTNYSLHPCIFFRFFWI